MVLIQHALMNMMKFDANQDGRLSLDELSRYLDCVNAQMGLPAWTNSRKRALFDAIDKDKNGSIEIAEAVDMIKYSMRIQ